MAATAETIWQVPVYLPYLQPALTDEALMAAEAQIGFQLPAELLTFLQKQNGGPIRYSLPEMVHGKIAGIGPNFPSLKKLDWEDEQENVSFPLQGLVPFDGDGHWHLCLDYRQNLHAPSITHADIECDQETRIADSFAEYLAMLELRIGNEYVLPSNADIEKVKVDLSALLGTKFDPPDSTASGYPVHRASLGSQYQSEWIWISPNIVPRGFARPEDENYTELKDLLPGTALRFHELPANCFILSMTDGAQSSVLEACALSRMIVRHLREVVKG